jgi:trypsin
MLSRSVLLVLLLILATWLLFHTNSKEALSTRIIGGRTVDWKQRYPWFVSLGQSWKSPSCGGSLITKDCVLTAAHCIFFNQPSHVRIGATEVRKVKAAISHPKFTGQLDQKGGAYDIGILFLENPSAQQPVGLTRSPPAHGSDVTIIGKGLMQPNMTNEDLIKFNAPRLQEARMKINVTNCPLVTTKHVPSLLGFICLVSEDQGGCNGDSGGPAIQWKDNVPYVAGVTSNGKPGCGKVQKKTFSVLYTSVPHHMKWIETTVARHSKYPLRIV